MGRSEAKEGREQEWSLLLVSGKKEHGGEEDPSGERDKPHRTLLPNSTNESLYKREGEICRSLCLFKAEDKPATGKLQIHGSATAWPRPPTVGIGLFD